MIRTLVSTLATMAVLSASAPVWADTTLDVVAQFEIKAPEPSTSGYIFTRMGIAETLVNADAEGRLTPGLATAWHMSDDGLTWTFTPRDGLMFHDGSPMTAETVLDALEIAHAKPGPLARLPITGMSAGEGEIKNTLSERIPGVGEWASKKTRTSSSSHAMVATRCAIIIRAFSWSTWSALLGLGTPENRSGRNTRSAHSGDITRP